MAIYQGNATLGYAQYNSTNWTSGSASQGAYSSGTMTASNSRVGFMVFEGLGDAVKGKTIKSIGLAFKADASGQGGTKVLTLHKSNYQTANTSVRGSAYVGDNLGTLSGNYYDNIQTYDLTEGEVFNNLKVYFEAGNSALVCYNGDSNNYLKISVAQISITYEDGGVVYRYNGSTWEKCEVYYYDGSAWVRVQPYYGTANGWERI